MTRNFALSYESDAEGQKSSVSLLDPYPDPDVDNQKWKNFTAEKKFNIFYQKLQFTYP